MAKRKAKLSTQLDPDVAPIHVGGVTYRLQWIHCGKDRCRRLHGPYWYAYWKSKGTTRSKYIGKKLPADVRDQGEAQHGRWYTETVPLPIGESPAKRRRRRA